MAILKREDFFSRLHDRMGDDTSDEAISFLEDMTDTYDDMEKRANGDGINWEQKYKDLDETWKKRYSHRFFSGKSSDYVPDDNNENNETNEEDITIDELFSEKKGE